MNRYSNPTPLHFLSSFGSLLLLSSAIAITSGKSAAHAELGGAVVIEGLHHLEHIFTALQAREQGRGSARITHIGDSHIIADFWTGEMRTRLQNRFGDGGRGFVLGERCGVAMDSDIFGTTQRESGRSQILSGT